MSHAARYPTTRSLKFKICKCSGSRLLLLRVYPVSRHTSPALEAGDDVYHLMMQLASSVHIIPDFAHTIKVRTWI